MRRWLLGLNVLLFLGVAWGSYWLYDSANGAALRGMPVPEERGAEGWEQIEVPSAAEAPTRSPGEYATVYENTLFREERKYSEPDKPGGEKQGPSLPAKLPNIGLRGIARWGTGEQKVYFEVEVTTETVVSNKRIPTKTREVKPFYVGDEISEGWKLAAVEGMEVLLESAGAVKRIALGKPSEFDNLPTPTVQAPTAPRGIRTEAGSVIYRGQPAVPPQSTKGGAPAASGEKAEAKQGPVVMTGAGSTARPAPRVINTGGQPSPAQTASNSEADKLQAMDELKKLREYVEKRRAEEGAPPPRGR
jgi:hypothetical protein